MCRKETPPGGSHTRVACRCRLAELAKTFDRVQIEIAGLKELEAAIDGTSVDNRDILALIEQRCEEKFRFKYVLSRNAALVSSACLDDLLVKIRILEGCIDIEEEDGVLELALSLCKDFRMLMIGAAD